jgi:hypothetical protein
VDAVILDWHSESREWWGYPDDDDPRSRQEQGTLLLLRIIEREVHDYTLIDTDKWKSYEFMKNDDDG